MLSIAMLSGAYYGEPVVGIEHSATPEGGPIGNH
jgi:hypothetical protein